MTLRRHRTGSFNASWQSEDAAAANRTSQPAAPSDKRRAAQSAAIVDLAKEAIRSSSAAHQGRLSVSDQYLGAFCRVLRQGQCDQALNMARAFASRGANYSDIAEGLFATAARRLGDAWSSDTVSLVDVNKGLFTLARTHTALSKNWIEATQPCVGSALFAFIRGQAHTLGLSFATEHFRRNGWTIRYMPATTLDELLTAAEDMRPDIVGMTAATDADLHLMKDVIDRLQRLPARPRVMIGGSAPRLMSLGANAVLSRLDMGLMAANRMLN